MQHLLESNALFEMRQLLPGQPRYAPCVVFPG
jgi:hypothetical protein